MNVTWCGALYAHMEWADALVWERVLAHEPAAQDSFVRESLLHLHQVQRAYLDGWTGSEPRGVTLDEFEALLDLREWGRAYYPEARAFLDSLQDADLSSEPPVLWPELVERYIGRPPVPATLGDMVFQVASHSVHHRAQINRRLRELGGDPPFIDYIACAWLGRPAPGWPRLRITVREGTAAHVPALERMREPDRAAGPADPRMARYLLGEHHPHEALQPRVIFVAESEAGPVGYIGGHRTTRYGCEGELQYLYVTPLHRRTGVATALLRALARWFGQREIRRVCVDVEPSNAPARGFYEACSAEELNPHWLVWTDLPAAL